MGNTVSSTSDSVEVFMKGGGCKESWTAFQGCVEKNKESLEKNTESVGRDCYARLKRCMNTHSEYYQPVFAAEEVAKELMMKDLGDLIVPSAAGRDETECEGDADVAKEIDKFHAYLEGGGCMESFTASKDCWEEAEKNKEDVDTKCGQHISTLFKCVRSNSDYYHPIFEWAKSAQEHMWRELEKSL